MSVCDKLINRHPATPALAVRTCTLRPLTLVVFKIIVLGEFKKTKNVWRRIKYWRKQEGSSHYRYHWTGNLTNFIIAKKFLPELV